MIKYTYALLFITFLVSNSLYSDEKIFDDSLENILSMKTELKADIGSRSGSRNFLESRSPIDVITFEQIEHSGLTSLTDVLRYFVAGFNAPNPSINDGSDHVRAFTLRGMSPDQVLVLINGKRVHTSALLHVNGTIGRGSSNVDLDTIVVSSIEKIEILRDGAAAQYGSDAISGVINIILKGIGHKNSISVHAGKRKSGDGLKLQAGTFINIPMKYDGFVNLSISAEQNEETQRAGADRRLSPPEVKTHFGLPESKSFGAVLNVELPQKNNINIYTHSLLNYRDSKASAFFRTPDVTRPIYPNGFLPMINANILDYSFAIGAKGEIGDGIYWDLSNKYGYNDFKFSVNDSMNYALGASSPASFNNGSLSFLQNTTNFDVKTSIDKFDLAFGIEYRYENYKIEAGDEASYYNSGSQGFTGFRPENETDSSRNSYAFYVDTIYNFTNALSLEGAVRYENFSDFGSTTNLKLALAYKVMPELLLRTSASTGFRAPSLSQSNYSLTSSYLSGGVIITEGVLKPNHEVSKIFGAEDLVPEKSKHFSVGGVYQPIKDLSLVVDYFFTEVDNRIMASSNLSGTTAAQIAVLAANSVNKASFFTNAVDTKTQGIDIKVNYKYTFENSSKLDLGVWYSYSKNEVVNYNTTSITIENSFKQIDRMENGQPHDSIRLLTNYELNKYNIALNVSRYGSYTHVPSDTAYKFKPLITTDLDIAYSVSKKISLAIGGTNIFDKTPSTWNGLSGIGYGYDGIMPYSNHSPAGFSGAYYYVRALIKF